MDPILSAATFWVLITVTTGGVIHQESGFTNEAICEDAVSIARYGQTVAEYKEAQRRADEARKLRDEKWRAAHPPREPKTKEEKEIVKRTYGWGGNGSICGHSKDGLIYDDECLLGSYTMGSYITSDNAIKFARCLPDPGQ